MFIRTSTDIPFPIEPTELSEYISIHYAGKCLAWREVSGDDLIKIYKSTWINLEELLLAKEDSMLLDYATAVEQYCKENKIIISTWID
jgi:hypothetical protein